ncbi:RIIa domain-containing protein 1 isoform X3 [Tursiops truncatus]|uniref:RIIa domain-containing protein 1 isoform X3 n=1 Tax=Tursiops truncatus TaxID=9739 RepID=UPI003CCF3443
MLSCALSRFSGYPEVLLSSTLSLLLQHLPLFSLQWKCRQFPTPCSCLPRPLLERAGPGQGRVLTSRASRRLDDRDKMATLPGGIQGLYPEALSPEQLEKLRGFKIQTRITNEKYLRTHKEVELLISGFFREMLLKRPDNIQEFAAADAASDSRYAGLFHGSKTSQQDSHAAN